jgi:hypothetical protein
VAEFYADLTKNGRKGAELFKVCFSHKKSCANLQEKTVIPRNNLTLTIVPSVKNLPRVARRPLSRPLSSNVAVLKNEWPRKICSREWPLSGREESKSGRRKLFINPRTN